MLEVLFQTTALCLQRRAHVHETCKHLPGLTALVLLLACLCIDLGIPHGKACMQGSRAGGR